MERDIDTFINFVIPTSLIGDSRLTFLERLLLIDILSLCKKKVIVELLINTLKIYLVLVSKQYQKV